MRGAIPPLPNTPSWRGAQLKKPQGQLYILLIIIIVIIVVVVVVVIIIIIIIIRNSSVGIVTSVRTG
jgi:heme/copper-type cytochrome/quinol oxidase subunit 2